MYLHAHTRAHTHTHAHTRAHMHTHEHTRTHTHTHAHTRTHTVDKLMNSAGLDHQFHSADSAFMMTCFIFTLMMTLPGLWLMYMGSSWNIYMTVSVSLSRLRLYDDILYLFFYDDASQFVTHLYAKFVTCLHDGECFTQPTAPVRWLSSSVLLWWRFSVRDSFICEKFVTCWHDSECFTHTIMCYSPFRGRWDSEWWSECKSKS